MKIAARNLLAEAILNALDDPEAAVVLRCIATYCNTTGVPPASVPIETLCAALPDEQSVGAIRALQHSQLLSWETRDGKAVATLVAPLAEDYRSTIAKLLQYHTALVAWVPGENGDGRTTALTKAVCLFNHHLFFEVHEVLEEQWKQENGDVRLFLQGLIQIAVAFHHLHNNNFRGATALLHDGMAKITLYQPEFLSLEVRNFVSCLLICQRELQRLGPEHFQQFPLEMIPSLQFVA